MGLEELPSGGEESASEGTDGPAGDGDSQTGEPPVDGGPVDGGAPDEPDRPVDDPFDGSIPSESAILAQHNFELGVPNGGLMTPGGFVRRSEDNVQSGDFSMYTYQEGPGVEAERWDNFAPLTSGKIYVRGWFFLPEGTVTDWIKILAHNGQPGGDHDLNVLEDGSLELLSDIEQWSEVSEPDVVPFGSWFCLQTETLLSNDEGHVHVWIDEEYIVSLGGLDTVPRGGVTQIAYGIGGVGTAQFDGEVFVDNYITATEPIGCDFDVPLEDEEAP